MSGLPASFEDDLSREPAYTSQTPCPECGCDPASPWGCGCGNPYCLCSEKEDDDE